MVRYGIRQQLKEGAEFSSHSNTQSQTAWNGMKQQLPDPDKPTISPGNTLDQWNTS